MVPVAWVRLLEQIEKEQMDVSGNRLRTLVSGGGPLDPDLKQCIERVFGRTQRHQRLLCQSAGHRRGAAKRRLVLHRRPRSVAARR